MSAQAGLTTIATVVRQCIEKLQQCTLKKPLMTQQWAENRLADFQLWSDSLGALAGPKASLDARLRTEPETRDFVLQSLTLFGSMLDQCLESAEESTGESHDRSRPGASGGSDHESFLPNPQELAMEDADTVLDQLARYALAIRKAGSTSRLRKADRTFDESAYQELRIHLTILILARPQTLTQIRQHLRPSGAAAEHDYSEGLDAIQERLVLANLRRRHRFTYARRHAVRLAASITSDQDLYDDPADASAHKATASTKASINDGGAPPLPTVKPPPNADPTQRAPGDAVTITTATSVHFHDQGYLWQLPSIRPQDTQTEFSTTASRVRYPQPPKRAGVSELFQCPCCCQALPSLFADRTRWKKHVMEDVAPYTCVLDACPQPMLLYPNKDTWLKHMKEAHPQVKVWQCALCASSVPFHQKRDLERHVRDKHASSIQDVLGFVDACETLAPLDIRSCPLCSWAESQSARAGSALLIDHVAEHLHTFALCSLPWALQADERDQSKSEDLEAFIHDWIDQTPDTFEQSDDPVSALAPDGDDHSKESAESPAEPLSLPAFEGKGSDVVQTLQELLGIQNYISNETFNSARSSRALEQFDPEDYFHQGADVSSAASIRSKGSTTSETRSGHSNSSAVENEKYQIAIFCAPGADFVALRTVLQEEDSSAHQETTQRGPRKFTHVRGQIGCHHVVLSFESADKELFTVFPNIRMSLLVGTGSATRVGNSHGVNVGDIVVSQTESQRGERLRYTIFHTRRHNTVRVLEASSAPIATITTALQSLVYDRQAQLRHDPARSKRIGTLMSETSSTDEILPDDEEKSKYGFLLGASDQSMQQFHRDAVNQELLAHPRTIRYGGIIGGASLMDDTSLRNLLATAYTSSLCSRHTRTTSPRSCPSLTIIAISDLYGVHPPVLSNYLFAAVQAAVFAIDLIQRIPGLIAPQDSFESSHHWHEWNIPVNPVSDEVAQDGPDKPEVIVIAPSEKENETPENLYLKTSSDVDVGTEEQGSLSEKEGPPLFTPKVVPLVTSTVSLDQVPAKHPSLPPQTSQRAQYHNLSLLIQAVSNGQTEEVNALLKFPGINYPDARLFRVRALTAAVSSGHFTIVQSLLDHGLDLEGREPDSGCTPLFIAVTQYHTDILRLLLERKDRLGILGPESVGVALRIAMALGHDAIASLLIDHGADAAIQARYHDLIFEERRADVLEILGPERAVKCGFFRKHPVPGFTWGYDEAAARLGHGSSNVAIKGKGVARNTARAHRDKRRTSAGRQTHAGAGTV